jgi:hypothetical protein
MNGAVHLRSQAVDSVDSASRAAAADIAAGLAGLTERVRPVALAEQQVLPVRSALEPLVPWAGLRRGAVVGVAGPAATSLALALVAGPSRAGSWTVAVGFPSLGLTAADELGVDLSRFAVVDRPEPGTWGQVLAALVGAVDVVLVRPDRGLRHSDARRLAARARERGSILVPVGDRWPEGPDLVLSATSAAWTGLGQGHGHLRGRKVRVEATGRRSAARRREVELWLLDPDGQFAVVEHEAAVVPLAR